MSTPNRDLGLPASRWEPYFRRAQVELHNLDSTKSSRAKSTAIGNFLARNVERTVLIAANDRTGRAKLCVRDGRARQRLYYVEVEWDGSSPEGPQLQTAVTTRCDAVSSELATPAEQPSTAGTDIGLQAAVLANSSPGAMGNSSGGAGELAHGGGNAEAW